MKHEKFDVDLSEWNLETMELIRAIEPIAYKLAAEALMIALNSDDTYAYFPIEWNFGDNPCDGIGGKPPADALTMYLRFGLESDEEKPTFSFSVRDVVKDFLDGVTSSGGGIVDTHIPAVKSLRDGFKMLTAELDAKLP